MAWSAPRTYIAGEVHAASTLNTDHRDNLLAIIGGTVELVKITIDGGSAPSVSGAGLAIIYYDTTEDEIMVSKNGGSYISLGKFLPNDPVFVGGTMFGFGG